MKKIVIGLILIITLTALIGIINGCGKSGSNTIAVVNDYEITDKEFNEYFNRMRLFFSTAEEEYNKKREFLDSVIITRLLVQAAYEKNVDKSSEIARIVLSNKNRFLLDILYQRNIAPYTIPTEAEKKEFHDNLEFKYRASHILLDNIDTAQVLLERIKVGENFEQLAFDYSLDPSAKRNRGDLGYFVWGTMVDAFQEAAIKMEPGEVSPPIKSQYGYHLIKMVDKLPNENRGSYGAMEEFIDEQVRKNKAINTTEAFMNDIKENHPINIEIPTCEYLIHKREILYPPQLLKSLPKNDFDPKALDRDEKELILATMEGSHMTISEYLDEIKNIPAKIRPNFDDYDSLAAIIFELKKEEILALAAIREGYDNDSEYLEKMKLFKELNMAEIMRNDSFPEPVLPDEQIVRQYYDEHLDEFTTSKKVHVYEILLNDEILAKKLVRELKSLKAFKSKAEDLTERPGYRNKSGDLGHFDRRLYPAIFDLAIKTPIGGIAGPVVISQKYSIFYVVDKVAEQKKDFLGVKRIIINKLKAQNKIETFNTWIDERMKASQIDINEDAIWATIDISKYSPVDSTTN